MFLQEPPLLLFLSTSQSDYLFFPSGGICTRTVQKVGETRHEFRRGRRTILLKRSKMGAEIRLDGEVLPPTLSQSK
jgi:hypothetical protein